MRRGYPALREVGETAAPPAATPPVAEDPRVVVLGVVGTVADGLVVVVAGGAAAAGALVAGTVTVFVIAAGAGPESPASFTSEAAIAPSESAATIASAATGPFQLGEAARRVRAAAPQFRHHSWLGASGVLHSGHVSAGVGAAVADAGAAVVEPDGWASAFTIPARGDG